MGNRTDLLHPGETGLAAAGYLAAFKAKTREAYTYDLLQWFAWCKNHGVQPLEVKRAHIELFSHWMTTEKGYAPKTVDRRLSTVCGFYRSACIDEYIDHNPSMYVRRPKVPTESPTLGLSYLEFATFLATAEDLGPNCHGLATLLGMLGLRVSEACSINVEDFGEERGHQIVRIVGKGDKPAVAPLPPAILRVFTPLRNGRTDGPLLRTRTGARMDRSAARRAVTRIRLRAGIDKAISPHSLRHTYITQMLDAGVDLRDVQIAARHATPTMTVRYDRARKNLDRHANYILAARMSS